MAYSFWNKDTKWILETDIPNDEIRWNFQPFPAAAIKLAATIKIELKLRAGASNKLVETIGELGQVFHNLWLIFFLYYRTGLKCLLYRSDHLLAHASRNIKLENVPVIDNVVVFVYNEHVVGLVEANITSIVIHLFIYSKVFLELIIKNIDNRMKTRKMCDVKLCI